MKTCLVGYTGFVGSNLALQHQFTEIYNSKNIEKAFGTQPDLLVYSGVRAEKFLANQNSEEDFETVKNAFDNIKKIQPKRIVLISTIDVYKKPDNVTEETLIDTDDLHPYGLNRYYLEQWVEKEFPDSLIVRLPGLFGVNIKKNFLYDFIHIIPSLLRENKFEELSNKDSLICDYYIRQDNGFYKCRELSDDERRKLKNYFNNIGFSALNFTDSRGSFQFYNLNYLWNHINIALDNRIFKLNLATEPVTISEIYRYLTGREFINEIAPNVPYYNFRTIHDKLYGGQNGYIFTKQKVLEDIKKFVEEYR
ncbi:MAG: NAD(P)-dependent oxidoreductase [Clostridiales bacterium]|nr:NAD(P)-dependent oxidoreductase [Clostridiales bacterium]